MTQCTTWNSAHWSTFPSLVSFRDTQVNLEGSCSLSLACIHIPSWPIHEPNSGIFLPCQLVGYEGLLIGHRHECRSKAGTTMVGVMESAVSAPTAYLYPLVLWEPDLECSTAILQWSTGGSTMPLTQRIWPRLLMMGRSGCMAPRCPTVSCSVFTSIQRCARYFFLNDI